MSSSTSTWELNEVRQWVNRDPLTEVGHRTLREAPSPASRKKQVQNPYTSAANNFIFFIDKDGLAWAGPFGGDCVNNSASDEWILLGNHKWRRVAPGEGSGNFEDCEGMTCSGRFYYVENGEDGACDKSGSPAMANCNKKTPSFPLRGWSPYDGPSIFSRAPGQGPIIPPLVYGPYYPHRGADQLTPPGYYWPPVSSIYRGPMR
jgi:hypothetical protein